MEELTKRLRELDRRTCQAIIPLREAVINAASRFEDASAQLARAWHKMEAEFDRMKRGKEI